MIIWYLSMLFLDVPWYTMVLFLAPFNWIGKLVYIWTVVGNVNVGMCFFVIQMWMNVLLVLVMQMQLVPILLVPTHVPVIADIPEMELHVLVRCVTVWLFDNLMIMIRVEIVVFEIWWSDFYKCYFSMCLDIG